MNKIWIILVMIFCHIIDDFHLQGILANMKQKQWWINQDQYSDRYKYDYIISLIFHSFSWAFMIMLPIYLVNNGNIDIVFIILFCLNIIIHCITDDLKANKKKLNLIQDQIIHVLQILMTAQILL